ncbi:MAG TPA: HpaII family restriction endonuclease, partial [Ignavibacteriaceae bacterium]
MVTGNKGEWSEYYTFLKILVDRRLISADSDLAPIPGQDIPVLKVYRNEIGNGDTVYSLSDNSDNILISPLSSGEYSVSSVDISTKLATIFSKIACGVRNENHGFNISEGEELMGELGCSYLRGTPSGSKEDISMLVHDPRTGQEPRMSYSIKSQVGSASSLLNASGATNFIFEVVSENSELPDIDTLNNLSTAKVRVGELISNGFSLRYVDTQNSVFKENMELIDTNFPELIATLLLKHYTNDIAELSETINSFGDRIHLQNSDMGKRAATYKTKHFLSAVALGLKPSRVWDGNISATGGYLILKADGELVCYHIFNMDSFKKYLLKFTKFERGSESRHGYGKFYRDGDGRILIKLNL